MSKKSDKSQDRLDRRRCSFFVQLGKIKKEHKKINKIYLVARRKFSLAITDYSRKVSPPSEKEVKQHTYFDPSSLGPSEKKSAPVVENEGIKKIFRKIAKQTHPDMLFESGDEEKVERIKMFQEARLAAIKKDWMALFEIAQALGVDTPKTTSEHNQFLKNKIEELKKEMSSIQRDPAWVWYHTSSEKVRAFIVEHYFRTRVC